MVDRTRGGKDAGLASADGGLRAVCGAFGGDGGRVEMAEGLALDGCLGRGGARRSGGGGKEV